MSFISVFIYLLFFCSTKLQNYSSHGAIFTPNWPLKYPKSSSCSWTFHPPQSKVVRIFFSSFELEDENDNFHDCDPDRDPLKGDDIRINGEFTVHAHNNNNGSLLKYQLTDIHVSLQILNNIWMYTKM